MTINNDKRCFIDCNSEIKLVKDLPLDSYEINEERGFISLLEDDCGEKLVSDTYDLHESLEVLQKLLSEI